MHPAIIIGIIRSLIVDVAMGQIPRSTERISSFIICPMLLTHWADNNNNNILMWCVTGVLREDGSGSRLEL